MIRKFTAEQKQWCIENYPNFTRKELAVAFNIAFNETRKLSQVISFLKNHKITSGRTGCFVKGRKSWNDGVKGVMKSNSTSFKKGHRPHNYLPVGTERVVKGGYVEVKTADPDVWTQKSRIVYESVHGPLANNVKVRFRDGNPGNLDPDNLFVVNNAEHIYLTRLGFKTKPEASKDTVILIAKLQAKTNDVKNKAKEI